MSATAKAYKGLGMNGFIAGWYAKNASRSIDEYTKDARRVAERIQPGSRVLEVASGPGYQAIALATLGRYRITGVDISDSFVRIASENASTAGVARTRDTGASRSHVARLRLAANDPRVPPHGKLSPAPPTI